MIQPADALVVDASVAIKWHLTDEDDTAPALALLTHFLHGQVDLLAPDQIRYEVPSAIVVATLGRKPRITQAHGKLLLDAFFELPLTTMADSDLILAAYPLVHEHGCAFYDSLYLALAQRLSLPFVTADRKLFRRVQHLPWVIWIGNYATP